MYGLLGPALLSFLTASCLENCPAHLTMPCLMRVSRVMQEFGN